MSVKSKTANSLWLEAAALFRKIKASTIGFETPEARADFVAGRFAWLEESLSKTKSDRAIFKEILRLGSVSLFDASLALHGRDAWSDVWPTVGAGDPAGSGNVALLRRLMDVGFDLQNSCGKILCTAARTNNVELLDLWFDAGLDKTPDPTFSLIKVIEDCGPACAPRIHALIVQRGDSCSAYSLGHAFNKAIVTEKPKSAAYMRAIGVQLARTSPLWKKLLPEPGFLGQALELHYRRFEGSAHAELAFKALEPDPVALLGRPKHAAFAGLSLGDLFTQSQGALSADAA